jgi:hypothetical protein
MVPQLSRAVHEAAGVAGILMAAWPAGTRRVALIEPLPLITIAARLLGVIANQPMN